MESSGHLYNPVLEDISDEDDDQEDIIVDVISPFPNDECSRTSPGNHATVRRWRQRSHKEKEGSNIRSSVDSILGKNPMLLGKTSSPMDLTKSNNKASEDSLLSFLHNVKRGNGVERPDLLTNNNKIINKIKKDRDTICSTINMNSEENINRNSLIFSSLEDREKKEKKDKDPTLSDSMVENRDMEKQETILTNPKIRAQEEKLSSFYSSNAIHTSQTSFEVQNYDMSSNMLPSCKGYIEEKSQIQKSGHNDNIQLKSMKNESSAFVSVPCTDISSENQFKTEKNSNAKLEPKLSFNISSLVEEANGIGKDDNSKHQIKSEISKSIGVTVGQQQPIMTDISYNIDYELTGANMLPLVQGSGSQNTSTLATPALNLNPSHYPNMSEMPLPYPYHSALPLHPPVHWNHPLENLQYPSYYTNTPYYHYLQQQILLLHHHNMSALGYNSPPFNLNMRTDSTYKISDLSSYPDHNKLQNINIDQEVKNTTLKVDGDSSVKEKTTVENIRKLRLSTDSGIELSNASKQDVSSGKENEEIITVDEDKEYKNESIQTQSNLISSSENIYPLPSGGNELPKEKAEPTKRLDNGLYLLAESIETFGDRNQNLASIRKTRYASTDCCDQIKDSLQILCDVANAQQREPMDTKKTNTRVERSKSLDSFKPVIDRNHNSTASENNVKEFIRTKSMIHKKENVDYKEQEDQNLDEMDAWEIELRIQLADKQRRYNEINRKLLKIQKIRIRPSKKRFKEKKLQKKEKKTKRRSLKTNELRSNQNECSYRERLENIYEAEGNNILNGKMVNGRKKIDEIDSIRMNSKNSKEEHSLINMVKEKEFHNKKAIKLETWQVKEKNLGECREPEIFEYKHKKIRRESKESLVRSGNQSDNTQAGTRHESLYITKDKALHGSDEFETELIKSHDQESCEFENRGNEIRRILKKKKKKKEKRKKEKKSKKDKNHPHHLGENIDNHTTLKLKIPKEKPVSHHCVLKPKDLVDGLRILKRVGGHFYPGRLTEISPPDIYGIVVDKERGNKPHIFSQEEILNEVVLEIKPKNTHELKDGTRVCAFWSNKMNYLHPGTVAGPDVDENYVIIQLDDGDSRDIHIDQVRYLPENYPLVVSADESVTGLFGARKRASSSHSSEKWKKKRLENDREKSEDDIGKDKNKKKKRKDYEWSVCVKEISPEDQGKEETFYKHSNFKSKESKDYIEDVDNEASKFNEKSSFISDKSAITAFLPPQQQLWSWSDEGHKISAKARKVFHNTIAKGEDTIEVGESAVFLSTGRPDRPYIGRIDSMWETAGGARRVRVKWFYHHGEVEGTAVGGGRVEDIKTEGALFSSSHCDENDVQTISHKCQVMSLTEFKSLENRDTGDTYFLAGEYDPVEGSIVFAPGVLCQESL